MTSIAAPSPKTCSRAPITWSRSRNRVLDGPLATPVTRPRAYFNVSAVCFSSSTHQCKINYLQLPSSLPRVEVASPTASSCIEESLLARLQQAVEDDRRRDEGCESPTSSSSTGPPVSRFRWTAGHENVSTPTLYAQVWMHSCAYTCEVGWVKAANDGTLAQCSYTSTIESLYMQ